MRKRGEILSAIVDSWRLQSQGRYFVRRGPIDWLHFDFVSRPYAVAVVVEASALPIPGSFLGQGEVFRKLTVSFEIFQKMPESGEQPELSEEVQEQLENDAVAVIADLHTRTASDGSKLIDGIENPDNAMSDWSDATIGVQGIVASIPINYHETTP
jgi:hypothetical protein